jgi:HSP20 family molecular chaperone IbpA
MTHEVVYTTGNINSDGWTHMSSNGDYNIPNSIPFNGTLPFSSWPINDNKISMPTNSDVNWDNVTIKYVPPDMSENHKQDVFIDKNGYHLNIEVAGYQKDQISIESIGQKIVVKLSHELGEFISDDIGIDDIQWIEQGLSHNDWEYSHQVLNEYNPDKLIVRVCDGILEIVIPPRPAVDHKLIS